MTQYLMNHPNKLIPLTYFVQNLSKLNLQLVRLQIIKTTFQKKTWYSDTTAGKWRYYKPEMSKEEAVKSLMKSLICYKKDRLLPGATCFYQTLWAIQRY